VHRDLAGFEIRSVQEMGWAGVKNGALIDLAAAGFDAIFTVDRDFGGRYEGTPPVGIVILQVGSTDPVKLRPHMRAVAEALATVRRGEIKRVGA
jgi:glucose-6-phosphate isomerase